MSDVVLFHLSSPFRESLMAGHLFYVEQANKRLLSQFEDMETEAEKAAEAWLEASSSRFDPDSHDPADFYERANDVGGEFYSLLSDMRDQTRLSVVAGMFHQWEKQLRGWLVREIERWHRGEEFTRKMWSADFLQISALLDCVGWGFSGAPYFRDFDACRLVVNVYKHGEGRSLDELKERYPEYLDDRFAGVGFSIGTKDLRDHEDLKVSNEQLQSFSDAIIAFWKGVPENTRASESEVPKWLEKAISKDRASQEQVRHK